MADLDRIKSNVSKMAGMNAPEADIDGYIASEGVSLDDVRNHQVSNTPQEGGIIDRVSADIENRSGKAQEAISQYKQGERTLPEAYLKHAGQYGYLANDIAGEAVKSVVSAIPDEIKDPVKDVYNTATDYLAHNETLRNTPGIGNVAEQAVHGYKNFSKEHPRTAENIDSLAGVGNLLAMFTPVKGQTIAGTALEAPGFLARTAKDLVTSPKNVPAKIADTLGQQAKSAAKSDYDLFESIGGGLHRDQVSKFSNDVNSLRPADPAKAAIWDRSGVKEATDTINNAINGGELSFSGAHALRADVNSQLKEAYMAGKTTKADHLMQLKERLTDVLTNPENASHLDIQAKNAWQSANHEFAKGSLLEDIELLAAKAAGKAQPANSLDTAINGFLNDPKKSSALLPAERAALEEVASKTHSGELLKSGANRIMSLAGAASGGPVGFLVGHYGSMLSRTTAETMKLRKLDKVYELINSRAAPEALTHKPPLMLTHDRRGTLERNISQRQVYEASKGQSGAPIYQGQEKQLALPSPNTPTPYGVGTPGRLPEPMTDRGRRIAQKMMDMQEGQPSDAVMKPPASQSLKLQESLKGIKAQQLNNMRAKLIEGEISQNKFTNTAQSSFGLSPSQARNLAKEILRDKK